MTHLYTDFEVASVEDLANSYFLMDILGSLTLEELACFLQYCHADQEQILRQWAALDTDSILIELEAGIAVQADRDGGGRITLMK